MATKEYACVKRTKKAFEESLALLAKENQLNKITVKTLCETAQLSRNAFYFHYKDIEELIADIENTLIEECIAMLSDLESLGFPKNVYSTIDGFIELFERRKNVVLMLLDKSFSKTFADRINAVYSEFNYKYFRDYHGEGSKISYDFFYMYMANGFYGIIKYWLEHPDKMSKEALKGLTYILIKRLLVPIDPDIENIVQPK